QRICYLNKGYTNSIAIKFLASGFWSLAPGQPQEARSQQPNTLAPETDFILRPKIQCKYDVPLNFKSVSFYKLKCYIWQ
ncbi:MAG: hypothetical protein PVJ35_08840, partial [Desulfobacterales bacterium]